MGIGSILLSSSVSTAEVAAKATDEVNFGIDGLYQYTLFGQKVWLTTTHIGLLLVIVLLIGFAIIANRVIKHADPYKKPGKFLNMIELAVETVDKLTRTSMGEKHGYKFSNYIGTLFAFILFANISGLVGLRSPTADYGVTLALALMTFVLIHYNGFKYQKASHVTNLFKPIFLSPINIIGEFATPLSMSLRLFGNVLSGTVMLGLVYGLLPKAILLVWPAALHFYFDIFSGAIQTYVFCMLTMVFISNQFDEA